MGANGFPLEAADTLRDLCAEVVSVTRDRDTWRSMYESAWG